MKALTKAERFTRLKPGSKWKHYKGGEYVVLMLARIEANQSDAVVYRQHVEGFEAAQGVTVIENGVSRHVINWVRDLDNFMGVTLNAKHKLVNRFEPVE